MRLVSLIQVFCLYEAFTRSDRWIRATWPWFHLTIPAEPTMTASHGISNDKRTLNTRTDQTSKTPMPGIEPAFGILR